MLSALRWFPVNGAAVRNVWIFKICVEVNTHAAGLMIAQNGPPVFKIRISGTISRPVITGIPMG